MRRYLRANSSEERKGNARPHRAAEGRRDRRLIASYGKVTIALALEPRGLGQCVCCDGQFSAIPGQTRAGLFCDELVWLSVRDEQRHLWLARRQGGQGGRLPRTTQRLAVTPSCAASRAHPRRSIAADLFGIAAAVWVVAALTFASGALIAVRMRETLDRLASAQHARASAMVEPRERHS